MSLDGLPLRRSQRVASLNIAADPDPPIAFVSVPQDAAPLPGTHGGGRTEESTLRRRGIDPETGLRVQSCSCKTQQECRRIMQKYVCVRI